MQMRILSGDDVRKCVDMPQAIEAMRGAFTALSAGGATVPVRVALESAHGVSLFMPAHLTAADHAGAKVVSVNPGNSDHGLPVIHAVVLVIDSETGRPTALMDGTWLTALRTGAVGGLAADLLAREDARTVALFGASVQARTQLEAVRCVRDIKHVRIFSPSGSSARALAGEVEGLDAIAVDSPDAALEGADIVITATNSTTPVFDSGLLQPGAHVTGVGSFTLDMCEVDAALVARARVIVDQREAIMEEAGEIVAAIRAGLVDESVMVAEIGEVLMGTAAGRTSPDEITFFKSVGNAVQDVAVAALVMERAEATGRGIVVDL
jgi:alanine dehydrogenase